MNKVICTGVYLANVFDRHTHEPKQQTRLPPDGVFEIVSEHGQFAQLRHTETGMVTAWPIELLSPYDGGSNT